MHKHNLQSAQLQEILEYSPDGMFTIDTAMLIQYVNPAFCKILGYNEDELYGTSITDHLGDISIMGSCMASVQATGHCNDQETIFIRKDGSVVHISKNVQALYDKVGNIHSILVSIRDMSALHQLNKELLESKYDALTNLPNRTKLLSDIDDIDSPFNIVLLNIDSFKEVNTFYGHKIADQLLFAFGAELVSYAKSMKNATVYKLPVDEYVILINSACSKDEISECITDLSLHLNKKIFTAANQEISLNVTIGIAGFNPEKGGSEEKKDVMSYSDMALKLAKKTRKNYLYYNESFHIKEDYENNLLWIKRLRNAIDQDRVVPFYQPIVNAETLQIEKYEALVRIIEEDGTVIPPIQFLEISKKVRLYHHITKIMLDKVIQEMVHHPKLQCSINLSIEDINDPFTNAYIVNTIRDCSYSDRIIFEILESEGIENYEIINEFICQVKKYGVKIAIDDFGAGYSNFVYITKLNIDYIKIDGSIIRNIDTDMTSQVITKTIIDFAAQLNIQTVAEFVHSQSIHDYLQTLSLNNLQGYFFGEPTAKIDANLTL
ncbi:MAG: EAL domain-containing protein [Sulfuricurvum sp.]|jgi:PAS domain S-box-containing protein/diguanylate cyclase (GGDEF)-like protein